MVLLLLDEGAEVEAQSDRTKDTALSLACSGGRLQASLLAAAAAVAAHSVALVYVGQASRR